MVNPVRALISINNKLIELVDVRRRLSKISGQWRSVPTLGQSGPKQPDPVAAQEETIVAAQSDNESPHEIPAQYRIAVGPLVDVPYPTVNLEATRNPVPEILDSLEFDQTDRFFVENPAISRSLTSTKSQAMLYTLIRNLGPAHVFEIGTYHAGSTEAICRALHANGFGILHTTDPFGADVVPPILSQWPAALREHVRFYPLTSMDFYLRMMQDEIRPDLIFIDGNHDYEFAAFDIQYGARIVRPGGFIIADNMEQAGAYFAAKDFLVMHPGWIECKAASYAYDRTKAFDPERLGVPGTLYMILRTPPTPVIGERPTPFPDIVLSGTGLKGVEVALGDSVGPGMIHVQAVVRGFASGRQPVEEVRSARCEVAPSQAGTPLRLTMPVDLGDGFERLRLELWLTWIGEAPLSILSPPVPFD